MPLSPIFTATIFAAKKNIFYAALLLAVCFSTPLYAQERIFSVDDGLPSDQIYDIIEDDYGYLWFATDQGLSRFDGYSFQNFDTNDGLTDNVIFHLNKLDNGQIWCITLSSTIFILQGEEPSFTPYKYNDTILKYFSNNLIDGLLVEPDGGIRASFKSTQGQLKIDNQGNCLETPVPHCLSCSLRGNVMKGHGNSFFYKSTNKQPFQKSEVLLLLRDSFPVDAVYLPEKSLGAFVFPNQVVLTKNNEIIGRSSYSERPIAAGLLNDSVFWISYATGGVRTFDDTGKELSHQLKSKSVSKLYSDAEGNKWISTLSNGVCFFSKKDLLTLTPLDSKNLHVNQLYNDENGDLYISYYNGNITSLINSKEHRSYGKSTFVSPAFVVYDSLHSQVSAYDNSYVTIHGIKEIIYSRMMMWSGDSLFSCGSGVASLFKEVDNEIKVLYNYPGQFFDFIHFKGKIYGASLTGLYCLENNEFIKVDIGALSSVRINRLEVFNDYLVLATSGSGTLFISKDHNVVRSINKENGVSSNFISNLLTENDSILWVCTNKGVNKIVFHESKTYDVITINKKSGLLSNQVWDVAIRKDTLWIGTSRGVNYVAIVDIENDEEGDYSYHLRLNHCEVNGAFSQFSNKQFSYDENEFIFYFSAISFVHRNELVYRYKLKGVDDDWSYTKSCSAKYPFLPPGKYEFIVQVKGDNQLWETNKQPFSFVICKAFWNTRWFLIFVVLSLSMLIYLFFRYRILSYNRDMIREVIRQVLRRVRRKEKYIIVRQNGQDVRIDTVAILFIQSSGNYLEIQTNEKKYITRMKISDFLETVPDAIEFLRIHRSFIIRLDKLDEKSRSVLTVKGYEVPVGRSYWEEVDSIQL